MSRAVALPLLSLCALLVAGCASRPPAAPRSAQALPRIMSMNPCIDAILVRVADPAQIVSISHYSHDAAASSIPIATARRFPANRDTAEEVVMARPDVVLLGPHVAPATQAAIRSVGVRIESVGVPATIAESLAQIRQVARAAGHAERGEALVRTVEDALAAAAPPSGTRPVSALVWQGGGLVPGAGTLMDELMTRAGLRNVAAEQGLAMWDVLPVERLAAHPPRLVLSDLAARGGAAGRLARLPGPRWIAFPDRLLQCAGPNMIEAANVLARARRAVS